VSDQVIAEFAVRQIPNLDQLIPTTGNDEWDTLRW
jgi:hypothetical protein